MNLLYIASFINVNVVFQRYKYQSTYTVVFKVSNVSRKYFPFCRKCCIWVSKGNTISPKCCYAECNRPHHSETRDCSVEDNTS